MLINDINFCNITRYHDGICIVSKQTIPPDPENRQLPEAKKERQYTIKKTVVRSLLIDLWCRRRSKFCLFFTVTLPFKMDEKTAAVCWDRFLDNLRKHYKLNRYVWIKEFQKSGNIHYHIVIDRNRIGVQLVQKTWNNVIYNVTGVNPVFNNSVRLGRDPVVRSIKSVAGYLSKYISKKKDEDNVIFRGKCMGSSKDLTFSRSITPDEFEELAQKYGLVLLVDEHFYRVYVLKNYYFDTS